MFRVINQVFYSILNKIEILGYNEYTIERFFRKKGYQVGNNNRIYIDNLGGEPYLVRIGNHCTIGAGVVLITHDGAAWIFREEMPHLHIFGKIDIKDNCFIGVRSIIMPNVTIGPNSIVAAGAVVTKDISPNTVVGGVPARLICSVDEYKKKCVKRWQKLNLDGKRDLWEGQLKRIFWSLEIER